MRIGHPYPLRLCPYLFIEAIVGNDTALPAREVENHEAASLWTSPDGIIWLRVPDDEPVFGGTGFQEMLSVTAGGPGLVAVGSDDSGFDLDAAVWVAGDSNDQSNGRTQAPPLTVIPSTIP